MSASKSDTEIKSRDEIAVYACLQIQERHERLREDIPRLDSGMFPHFVDQWITKRKPYRARTSPPAFEKMPFGYLFVRCRDFHNGSGYLGSALHTKMMAGFLTREKDPTPGTWMDTPEVHGARAKVREYHKDLKEGELFEMVDTLALVTLSGASRAAQAWERALKPSQ